jgi:stage II sporulation protein AA (anti-sigma F factor antagonist)
VNRLELQLERPNGRPVVVARLVGELDLATVADAGPEVLAAAGNESLVLDLAGLTFLDSAAVHLLFRLVKRFHDRGRELVFVVPAGSPASRVVEVIDLAAAAPVVPSSEEAVRLLVAS